MIVIAVEGIIGAGKTTLLKECLLPILLKKGWKVTLVEEPVEKWKESGILKKFYENPSRYAYHFQTKAFHDRIQACREQFQKNKDKTDIFLLERSIFSDTIFMKCLYEQNIIDSMELSDYTKLWEMWEELMPFQPDLIFYLKPSIDVCMARLKERAREGEETVSLDYQSHLEEKHDEIFAHTFSHEEKEVKQGCFEMSTGQFIPALVLETNSNFKEDEATQNWITDLLEEHIKLIKRKNM